MTPLTIFGASAKHQWIKTSHKNLLGRNHGVQSSRKNPFIIKVGHLPETNFLKNFLLPNHQRSTLKSLLIQ